MVISANLLKYRITMCCFQGNDEGTTFTNRFLIDLRMKFSQIAIIDDCGLTPDELGQIGALSKKTLIVHHNSPQNSDEILSRTGKSDAILVSWKTPLDAATISEMENVRYIGMCCSLYSAAASNVNIAAATAKGITVKGVRDYGDEGTVEFIFAQLIGLMKGFGQYQWHSTLQELKGKSMGIVGMGTLGKMVADTALHFGMQVYYNSRTPKPQLPENKYRFLSLESLVKECDVISTHVPKHMLVMTDALFALKKKHSIFVNTSLGPTYDKDALLRWLEHDPSSFAIFDAEGSGPFLEELKNTRNCIVYPKSSGSTIEAKKRLSQKVLQNIHLFFSGDIDNIK